MWIMTSGGFVSAVADRKDRTLLKVRARDRKSLVTMVEGIVLITDTPASELEIVTGAGTDYPYRVYVKREDFAAWLVRETMYALTYGNFKDELKHVRGEAWASTASKIWWDLMDGVTDVEGEIIGRPYYGTKRTYSRGAGGSWSLAEYVASDRETYYSSVWGEVEPDVPEDAHFLAMEEADILAGMSRVPTTEQDWFLSPPNRAALRAPIPEPSKGRKSKGRERKAIKRERRRMQNA